MQLIVVVLEFLFLQEDNLGGLGDVDADTGETLGLSNQSEDLRVEVHVQLHVVRVTNDQSGLQTGLGLVDVFLPLLSPEVFVREERVADLIVLLEWLLVGLVLELLGWELLHGDGDTVEEVAGPSNGAGNGRQVAHNRRRLLELLVLLLDASHLDRVVREEDTVLEVQVLL